MRDFSKVVRRLWRDEVGATDTLAYLWLVTIVVLGVIPGLVSLRDQFVQEFGDFSAAIENLNQSYSITVCTVTSQYTDEPPFPADPPGEAPGCIGLDVPAQDEL